MRAAAREGRTAAAAAASISPLPDGLRRAINVSLGREMEEGRKEGRKEEEHRKPEAITHWRSYF